MDQANTVLYDDLGMSPSPADGSTNNALLANTGGLLVSSGSSPNLYNQTLKSPEQLKAEIRGRVSSIVRSRSGPSFEERSALAAAKFRKQAEETEREQKEIIAASVLRGRSQPSSSPIRQDEPESIESRAIRGRSEVNKSTKEYWQKIKDLKYKMAVREPLYKLDEVAAAVQKLKDQQAARKKELKEDEAMRRAMIQSLQEKVLDRPLVMEEFEKKKLTATDLRRMATPAPLPFGVDRKVKAAVQRKDFVESQWYQQVKEIQQRQNDRVPLCDQKYPPYVRPEIPVHPRELGPLEKLIKGAIESPSFQTSQWAGAVGDMREKMNNREKLHEISYPKKWEEPPPVNTPSPFILKIQEAMAKKCEEGREKMAEEERKQRAILREIKKAGILKRDRTAIGLPAA